jgi:glycosyltransferase involved in cell wall biosynthesis
MTLSKPTKPLVSVIMPCFNSAEHLNEAIDSVLEQDYANIELIVVDDGSTDSSPQLLQQYGDRIKVIYQQNSGPAAARNTGMREATGDFIAFNDSDDIWLPGKLSAQIALLQAEPEIGLCYTGWIVWDQQQPLAQILQSRPDISAQERVPGLSGWLYLKLLAVCYIHTTTAVFRRDILQHVGYFNEAFRIGEDHDYWLRISQYCQVVKLKRAYSVYRDNPVSVTKKLHPKNYSLLVLEQNLQQFGLTCPSGATISQRQADFYLGQRHFVYGYQAMLCQQRQIAFDAFRSCVKYRYKWTRSLLLMLACSNKLTFDALVKSKGAALNASSGS